MFWIIKSKRNHYAEIILNVFYLDKGFYTFIYTIYTFFLGSYTFICVEDKNDDNCASWKYIC